MNYHVQLRNDGKPRSASNMNPRRKWFILAYNSLPCTEMLHCLSSSHPAEQGPEKRKNTWHLSIRRIVTSNGFPTHRLFLFNPNTGTSKWTDDDMFGMWGSLDSMIRDYAMQRIIDGLLHIFVEGLCLTRPWLLDTDDIELSTALISHMDRLGVDTPKGLNRRENLKVAHEQDQIASDRAFKWLCDTHGCLQLE